MVRRLSSFYICCCYSYLWLLPGGWLLIIILHLLSLLYQGGLSLSFLQLMPCWKGTWYWRLSLHDLQLLPRHKFPRAQVSGERSGNKLSHLLWFFVYVQCSCESSSLWPLHAFRLLPGWFFMDFFASVPVLMFVLSSHIPGKLFKNGQYVIMLIYSSCQAYTCSHYICPICSKSMGDMSVWIFLLDRDLLLLISCDVIQNIN